MTAVWVNQLLQGILLGGLYTLFATGLSLSAGVLRFVNIAHGDFIVLTCFVLLLLTAGLGLNPVVATLIVLPVAFLFGYALQRFLLQRVVGENVLLVILVTFGLSIIIENSLLEGFGADPRKISGGFMETATLPLGHGINVGLFQVLTFIAAVVLVAGLDALLYRTGIGAKIRAVSDDVAAADLIGLSSVRLYAIAMGISFVTIAIAAGFMSIWTNFDPASGPTRLLIAFEVIVMGGLGSLWGSLAGGILLGIAQSIGAEFDIAWQIMAGHIVFLIVLALRPQGLFPEILIMRATPKPILTGARAAFAAAVLLMAAAPFVFDANHVVLFTEFMSMLVLAIMWNLLAGYADIVTVGQHAFVGVGAYAFFGFAALADVDPYLSIPLAGVVALVIAVPTMILVFRLRTAYLAIGTWVVAELLMLAAGKLSAFGGGSGTSVPISIILSFGRARGDRLATIYWLAFGLAAVAMLVTYFLLRSRIGIGLTAMRDNEEGAAAIGVNITFARVLCFLGTAPFLGMAGAIITLQKLRIAPPASFSITDWTVLIIFNVVIGGIGSFEGPIIGTIVYFVLRQYLADLGAWNLILLGSFSILIILVEKRGIWGLVRRVLSEDLIPIAHRPSTAFDPAAKAGPDLATAAESGTSAS